MRVNVYVDGFNFYYGCLRATPYKWLDLAVSRSSGASQKMSAFQRDLLVQEMTGARLADAQQRVGEWLAAFEKRSKK